MTANLTQYAAARLRETIAIGFLDFSIIEYDSNLKTYIVERKDKLLIDGAVNHAKLKVLNGFLFCTCL